MKIELVPNESAIDTWAIIYTTQGSGKHYGKLTITTHRLLYDAMIDVSAKALLTDTILAQWKLNGFLEIDKALITDILVEKTLLAKKATITLLDGSKHTFNYGVLNIDKVVEAIRINCVIPGIQQ